MSLPHANYRLYALILNTAMEQQLEKMRNAELVKDWKTGQNLIKNWSNTGQKLIKQ